MNKIKIVIIGLTVLLLGASFLPSINAGTTNIKISEPVMLDILWQDNFDSYTNGQFLDGTPDDGGWKGWDNDPMWGSYVTDVQSLSSPHSIAITGDSDSVKEFSGLTSGQFTLTTHVYVPDDFVGNSYFILLSSYEDGMGQENKWALQLRFDAENGVVESEFDDENFWLLTDQWVEIKVEIDLDLDNMQLYYDGDLLIEKPWTAGPNNEGDGVLSLDAIDLFANAASVIYYDDFVLEGEGVPDPIPDLSCEGTLIWEDVTTGTTVSGSIEVTNVGETGSLLDWEVAEWPTWGTWTFTPASGIDLAKADSESIIVEVVAPSETNKEFTGTVKLVNSEDAGDFCEINVYLKTPRIRNLQFPILQRILEIFPNAFPLLREMLGL